MQTNAMESDEEHHRTICRWVEQTALPAKAKAANEFGQFAKDRNAFCLMVQAIAVVGNCPGHCGNNHPAGHSKLCRLEGPYYGGHTEIALKLVDGKSTSADQFQAFCAQTMLGTANSPIVVHVLMTFDGKAQVFTSFLTGASMNMQGMLAEKQDIDEYKGACDENLHRSDSCCAYCLAETRTDCLNCEHPTCKKKWNRKLKMCSGCRAVFYCSPQCQRKDWNRGHIVACKIFRWVSPRFNKENKPASDEILASYCSWMEAKALSERGVVLRVQDKKEDRTKDPKSPLFGMSILVD